MSQAQRRLAAIMFTDVVGFTTLGQTNENLALQLLEEHRGVVRPIVAKYRGVEVKTIGDAFLVEFASALEAVECSIEIQTAMHERNSMLQEKERMQMRIGIHVGDVVHSQGDILGDAVNVSSRIEPIAQPGGVCISEQAYDHVRNKLEAQMELLESKTLKNVKLPMDVYRIVMPWENRLAEESDLDTRRVAVLPLKNMSPDPNDEYFADGMTEELITALSSVRELTVIARTSVMQYKTAPKRVADIGKELGVGSVVEGSVRKAGPKVRITVQLINVKNEGHLWAQNYDKQLDDVFTVQSEVAGKVAEALEVQLVDSQRKRLERGSTKNPEAYNLYLKGIFYWNKRTPEALRKAVELFEQAVGIDPGFSMGYAGIAQAYNIMASNLYEDPAVAFPKAKEFALKALSLDDELAEAHAVLASVAAGFERDLDRAEAEFKRAIDLNPSYPSAHQWYSQLLGCENRHEEAWREINRALELSPLSLIINSNLADAHYYRMEFDKGIAQAKRVTDMDPNFSTGYPSLIENYIGASMGPEAVQAAERYAKLVGPGDGKVMHAYVNARLGMKEESRKLLSEIEPVYKEEKVGPSFIAFVHFILGDRDEGFEWLERAYQSHDRYILLIGIEKWMEPFRSDPRYMEMLKKIGLAGRLRV
ncbi:MAG TPA: adenylate/guanylate cyclase domain-containing protein [Nitrososphaerales archaeon]